ncbi:sialoadhesin-like isoform 1-T1 [Menidia menidia]
MTLTLVSLLLGATAFMRHSVRPEELSQAVVSVWPPGSKVYLGECVVLRCCLRTNSTSAWTYRWYRDGRPAAAAPLPGHLVSGENYSIPVVTREAAGSYWCKAEQRGANASVTAEPVVLSVSALPPPSLTLTPSSRLFFPGERFALQCPASQTTSTGWRLRHASPRRLRRPAAGDPQLCSALGGSALSRPDGCVLTAAGETSGLYWCEDAGGRSNAVSISVSYGKILLRTPALPVHEGDDVILYCQHRTNYRSEAVFFRGGEVISTLATSSSDRAANMTIANVTKKDEGFYKCALKDGGVESPESWLSVIAGRGGGSTTEAGASKSGHWKWIVLCCCAALLLIPLTLWLVRRSCYRTISTRSSWPISKGEVPAVPLPETKQDVTEVQWDLSWMEMSNLLDKQLYPST